MDKDIAAMIYSILLFIYGINGDGELSFVKNDTARRAPIHGLSPSIEMYTLNKWKMKYLHDVSINV
jgi:hypothetical protein